MVTPRLLELNKKNGSSMRKIQCSLLDKIIGCAKIKGQGLEIWPRWS